MSFASLIGWLMTKGKQAFAAQLISKRKLYEQEVSFLAEVGKDWNYVTPAQFRKMQEDKEDNFFLIDIREPEAYALGHIPGSINIFWLDILKPENMVTLPTDQEILLICYVGHTASQVLVILKMLGYKVKALKFGMGISPIKGVPVSGWQTLGYEVKKGIEP